MLPAGQTCTDSMGGCCVNRLPDIQLRHYIDTIQQSGSEYSPQNTKLMSAEIHAVQIAL